MNATLADIAKATGTSISTVSRVLTGAPAARRISQATRDRVEQTARQLGYRPNLVARSLRTQKSHTIALLVSDIANPWFGQLASLIEQQLARSGYSMMVCNSCEDEALEQKYLRLLPQKGIDGLIIVPLTTRQESLYWPLPKGLPVVVVDRPVEGVSASITSDQRQAAELLCQHLTRIGAKRVALARGPEHVFTHRTRAEVIRQHFEVVVEQQGPAQLETGRLLWTRAASMNVDAVVCTNNFLGMGVIEAMSAGGRLPPIACFDEIAMMNLLPMPIISCVQDIPKLADGAVMLLLALIAGATVVNPAVVPAQVVYNQAFAQMAK